MPKRKSKTSKALTKAQAKAVAQITNRHISKRAEKKYFDVLEISASPDYNGFADSLIDVQQGDTDLTRDGDSLYLRSIRVRGAVTYADTYNCVRILVFQWLMDDLVDAVSVSDILGGSWLGTSLAPHAPYKHDSRKRFRILYDKMYMTNAQIPTIKFDTGYLHPKVRKVQYNAGGITGSGKVYLVAVSDSAGVSHPDMIYGSRITFNDM